tara:strand:+ start:1355 stop:1531 length:177 start_codon:yes stop_codon:yes gene_type:complete
MEKKGVSPYQLLIKRLDRDNGLLLMELNLCLEKLENLTNEFNELNKKYTKLKTKKNII